MIDTIELSALMRQGTGLDEATADKIAQAILRASEMSPPVSRDYLDARLDATREHLDDQLKATREYLDGQIKATREYLDGRLEVFRENLDGRLNLMQERVEKQLAKLEANRWRMEARIYGGIGLMLVVAVFVQHYCK